MNVLPKKRAQQLIQFLTLSRNLSLPLHIPIIRNLPLWGKQIATSSMNWMHCLAKKIPYRQSPRSQAILHRAARALQLDEFSRTLFTRMVNRKFVWFAASLTMYGLFLFRIADDIFILHRTITQVGFINYAGAITAIALIWGGTIVFKPQPAAFFQLKEKTLKTYRNQKNMKSTGKTTKLATPIAVHIEPISATEPIPVTVMPTKPTVVRKKLTNPATSPKCPNHMTDKLNIPDSCLTCKELISCLSKLD